MDEAKKIVCTLIIPSKIYRELKAEVRELFAEEEGVFSVQFPADTAENTFLGEFICAFCEVVLIMNNPKYEITEECQLSTELLRFGTSEESYCLLVNIKYPGSDKVHHDTLYFKEVSQSLGFYTFELLGDQTLFSID
ncbi:hypothetical protein R2R35_14775 [Anaerocolumna sp. AGMB13020]|uniref:hypothetical protein n=1 Tax=Anaerocolumna sp. AGMB13020 TaxID=3081750 RepID=UPI00295308CA|nr:hypothetical protein [Anaerocolumna sp. AGMB13020]WOO35060.1 hypothetical protein R2R35_14775 [Anaerocolumna sp. AGMB13020]